MMSPIRMLQAFVLHTVRSALDLRLCPMIQSPLGRFRSEKAEATSLEGVMAARAQLTHTDKPQRHRSFSFRAEDFCMPSLDPTPYTFECFTGYGKSVGKVRGIHHQTCVKPTYTLPWTMTA
jgi:hypothetical protein